MSERSPSGSQGGSNKSQGLKDDRDRGHSQQHEPFQISRRATDDRLDQPETSDRAQQQLSMITPFPGPTMAVIPNPGGSSQRNDDGTDQNGRSNQERQLGNSTTVDDRRLEDGIKSTHGPWNRVLPGNQQQSFTPARPFVPLSRPPEFPLHKDDNSSPRIGSLIPPPPFSLSTQPIAGPSRTNNNSPGHPTTATTPTNNSSQAETRPEMLRYLSGHSAASTSDMRSPRTPGLTPNEFIRGDSKGYPFTSKRPELTPRDSHSSFSSRNGAPSSTHPFHLELTTKGRKRKRLAKACSACHKNKRRCDGFAPCSNCEFSSRVCSYLNSAGEAIPPPRTRETTTIAKEEVTEVNAGDCYVDELEVTNDPDAQPQMANPDKLRGPAIDLTWAAERESQRLYDLLQDSRRTSDKEAYDDRQAWLDAREKEAVEALSLAREGSPSGHQTGLGVDLNGDGVRGRTVASGSATGPTGQYSATTQGASSSSGNSRNSSSGRGATGNDRGQGNDGRWTDEDEGRRRRGKDDAWYTSVVDRIDADDALVEELCHQFFARMHPYQIMFHKPTFTHRRYLKQIPSALLHIMCALASRFVNDAVLLPPSAQDTDSRFPLHAKGEVLATRARQETDAWLRACGIAKEAGAVDYILRRQGDRDYKANWVDTEMTQAICLIGFYERCMGRSERGDVYFDMAVALLSHANPQYEAIEGTDVTTAEHMLATLVECRRRVTWMLYLADISAATNGRFRRLHDHDLAGTTLPGSEAGWNRHGSYKTPKARATFTSSGPDEQLDVGEFGHIVRILSIFGKIMEVSNRSTNSQISVRISSLEKSLQAWAWSLPPNWHFNNDNFVNNVNKLNSPIPAVSLSAFCFALAHALAESSQFYLQSAAALLGEVDASTTARRQSQAVDNLIVTLDAIGDIGRHSPEMFFPLHIVSNWLTHTNATLPRGKSPSLVSKQRELKLKHWWNDLHLVWGVETRATPRASNADLKRGASARQQPAPLPPAVRHNAYPSPLDHAETSKRTMLPSPATTLIRGDVQLPPLRADPYLSHHQPERALNIAPRKLSDLLDNAPSRHVITAPRPDVIPRGTLSNPTTNVELRHSRSPTDDQRLIPMAQNGLASANDERPASHADFEGRERKRPRLSDEAASGPRGEQSPIARTLSNEHDRPEQGSASEKPAEAGMNGMAVLATAAAASR